MRNYTISRKTAETDINLVLELDGRGKSEIDTGCGFLDHMLTLLASHGRFDLTVKCVGDVQVDYHHTVEDVGICLGEAFAKAVGDKKGIERYGSAVIPMDEALILCAVDLSGRDHLGFGVEIPSVKVGDFDTELVEEFWLAFVRRAECSLHFKKLAGKNSHHIIEGCFKAAARALRAAVKIDPERIDEIPSTKGVL
ncbi:MAG: imidazoleglycerol-phosphate dehydratase HisB [Ruminococcaceae bacterium]|nr:imidazoleglycerol-phosphate dehydratase HisB [Oscillospiraceae bacterium]